MNDKKQFTWLVVLWLALFAQAHAQANKFEPEIQKYEAADRAALPAKNGMLFVGSSSIRLWKDLAADFPGKPVINRGFGGSQLSDVNHFVERIVLPYRPRLILVYAGDNDLAAGKTPQQVLADFASFVTAVRAKLPRVKIAYISIKPSLARLRLMPQISEANTLIKAFVSKEKALSFIDVFTPMLRADGQPKPELFIDDGLHMTRAGYDIWRQAIAPYLR